MNWFQQNRWLGTFLIVFGICTLLALFFLFSGKSGFEEASARFNDAESSAAVLSVSIHFQLMTITGK